MPLDQGAATKAGKPIRARLGVDVGGTFTDVVLQMPDGRLLVSKVSSTPEDPGLAVREGVTAIMQEAGLAPERLAEIVHGTTVGSNTILQRKGAKTGLITTRGFRDVLEIARIRTPGMFDLTWEKPEPLAPRRYRREVTERMAADGTVVVPMDEASLLAEVDFLVGEGIQAIAICFLNSYINPAHEMRARALIEERHPGLAITASYEVLQEVKEYERTSTTVVNAYLLTEMRVYLNRLIDALGKDGYEAPLLVMSSAGGVMGADQAARKPVFVVGSGPAGGVVGAARMCLAGDVGGAIVFDMGGTTAKASIVEDGQPMLTGEYEFRDGISTPSRFVKGGGYMLKVPSIDIAEVGAGGGSIAWIDEGGLLRVGPISAGADPGPACYGRGNDRPTVTDANVFLGYFNPEGLAGGSMKIDPALSEQAIRQYIAEPLGMDVRSAALGIRRVANMTMSRALRAVSVERGRDPRDLALVGFGGSGPAHAVDLARMLGIKRVILPTLPGVFCAVGMLSSDVEHGFSRPLQGLLGKLDPARFDAIVAELKQEGLRALALEGFAEDEGVLKLAADLRYRGQNSELTVPCPDQAFGPAVVDALRAAFTEAYSQTYGYVNDEPAEMVALRLTAAAKRPMQLDFTRLSSQLVRADRTAPPRKAVFDAAIGPLETPVIARSAVGSDWQAGPLIVESYDTTVVVPPEAKIRADAIGGLVIEPAFPERWALD